MVMLLLWDVGLRHGGTGQPGFFVQSFNPPANLKSKSGEPASSPGMATGGGDAMVEATGLLGRLVVGGKGRGVVSAERGGIEPLRF